MSLHTQPRKESLLAAMRVARFEACTGIVVRHTEEALICGNCSFEVYALPGGGFRHNPNEVRAMRALVVDGAWPKDAA